VTFDCFRAADRRALAENARWVLAATLPDGDRRKIIVDESNKFSKGEHQLCAPAVRVVPQGFVRGMITVFNWMVANLVPFAVAPTTDAAVDVAVDRLRKLGVQYPLELAQQASKWFHRNAPSLGLRAATARSGAAR
jgi:hypothetical protein